MAELNVLIPKGLEKDLEELPENWSKIALEAIRSRAFELKLERSKAFRKLLLSVFDKMTEKSTLTDKDCLRLGREVNKALAKRYGALEKKGA